MSKKIAKVFLDIQQGILSFKCNNDGEIIRHDMAIFHQLYQGVTPLQLRFKLIQLLKPVFFNMPYTDIQLTATATCYEQIRSLIDVTKTTLYNTNRIIQELDNASPENTDRLTAREERKILFINYGDDARSKYLYDKVLTHNPDNVLYLAVESGYDQVNRKWIEYDVPMSIEELIETIKKQCIGKIISSNCYFVDTYLSKKSIYLSPILQQLKVSQTFFDFEAYDQTDYGFLMKAAYHSNQGGRFSCQILHEYWDRYYHLQQVNYATTPNKYDLDTRVNALNDEYDLVIMTNSRLTDIVPNFPIIIYILDKLDKEDIILDLKRWFYAMRFLVLNILDLDEFTKLKINSLLLNIFYTTTQFLKIDFIENLNTDFKLHLYGDAAWQTLFPQHYKGFINHAEQEALLNRREHLTVLVNWQTSWLDTSGPIFDAIARDTPFISFPSIVSTPELSALDNIAYRNYNEFNARIRDYAQHITQQDTTDALYYLKCLYHESLDAMAQHMANNNELPYRDGAYGEQQEKHARLLDQTIMNYLDKNEDLLRESYQVLFASPAVHYDITTSRYANSPICQRIAQMGGNIK